MEPVYRYVKGQGWVVQPNLIIHDRHGKEIRLEKRAPEVGERYFFGYGHSTEFDHRNTQYVARFIYEEFSTCKPEDRQYITNNTECMTLVRL